MTSYSLIILAVLIIYMVLTLIIGIVSSKRQAMAQAEKGFINNYFVGGRSMGGIVLAMTLVATFTSASSFIGAPGIAYSKGLVWVYISVIQIPTAFIVLGILGKKFAIISRKTNAVTVTDYLRSRYKSPAVVIISSIAIVLFFIAMMMSQFIGGAILLETITGLPYVWGLIIFSIIVIAYTSIGGFNAVAITDTIQAFVMLVGCFLILFTVIKAAGGYTPLIETLNTVNPTWSSLASDGSTPLPYILSFWVLVGIGVLGLPQTAVRGMAFKNTKSLHQAMIYGTVVVGTMMIVIIIVGVFAPAVLDPSEFKNTDYVVPMIVLKYMNPVVAGLFIAAPLSAIMSTVSSLLLLASAAIVKDIYMNYFVRRDTEEKGSAFEAKIGKLSIFSTILVGAITLILTLNPPDLIVWINLFAMGGLECAFLCPIIFGLYWKKANATGAIFSSVIGVATFLILSSTGVTVFGTSPIVISILTSVIAFIIGSLLGKKPDRETLELFY
ncbi:sodium/pantothenate symporter [Cytobacillus gottheilii]|nr:sodium/pantothenate symporter [Cytobacillus gottheilii]